MMALDAFVNLLTVVEKLVVAVKKKKKKIGYIEFPIYIINFRIYCKHMAFASTWLLQKPILSLHSFRCHGYCSIYLIR